MRLVKQFPLMVVAGSTLLLSACASSQLTMNTVEVSARVDDIYTQQTLENLSKFSDNAFAIPSQAILNTGQIQTTNTIQPSVTFPLSSQFVTMAANAASGITRTSSTTQAGAGASIQGVNSQQQNFTVAPLSDAVTLHNQQALYRHAVLGTPLLGNYQPPRLFFNNQFYLDPYFLQLPQCVLCARDQPYTFSYKVPVPALQENNGLPGHWLFVDEQARRLRNPINLGHFGNHDLYMEKSAYDEGVLARFVLATLPFTVPAEVLTGPPAPQQPTIIVVPSAGPAGPHDEGKVPGREGTLPNGPPPPITRYVIPPPAVSIPPATNQQLPPADRQNSIITINPSIIAPP